ncbi:MAG: aquaporin family protein [Methanobrevibacter sp.]|jgi:glycerol uptake facilitator protein|nr:aquaporin family protein [Candidatus Methanovirga basalitermitum]
MSCGIGKKMLSEILAAFIVVFFGLGSVVVAFLPKGAPTLTGLSDWLAVGFVFGIMALAVIYMLGKVSGCHLSPGVTIGLWITKHISGKDAILYIIAQLIGSIIATLLLYIVLPDPTVAANFVAPNPGIDLLPTFVAEVVGAFALMSIIMGVAIDSKAEPGFAGISVGLTVTAIIVFLGPVTGAGITPIRYFGPYVLDLIVNGGSGLSYSIGILLPLYFIATIVGSIIGALLYAYLAKDTDVCELPSPYQNK